jgi:hypothetical protein
MGGIYTLGSSFGTEVSYNLVYAVLGRDHSQGLYADAGSEGISFHHNIVANSGSGGLHVHWGRGLTFENNIVALCHGPGFEVDGDAQHPTSVTFTRNVVVSGKGDFIGPDWAHWEANPTIHPVALSNAYWDPTGRPVSFGCHPLAQWQAMGQERGSVEGDPLLADIEGLDFHFQPGPATASIGFEAIDPDQIGLYGDPGWVQAPRQIARDADPWPRTQPILLERFDEIQLGARVPHTETLGESRDAGSWARVVTRVGDAGRCLHVQDAPGLTDPSGPVIVWFPEMPPGPISASFRVLLHRPPVPSNQPMFLNAWQDTTTSRSHQGPRLFIDGRGQLTAAPGHHLLIVPFEQWLTIGVDADVGPEASGAYTVRVDGPGIHGRVFQVQAQPLCRLEWYGFGAPADANVGYELDDVEVRAR